MEKTLYSLRMPQAELHAMVAAAHVVGETASEYMRKAVRMRTATLAAEKGQSACFIGYPSTWTVVAVATIPTHNTGCPANVDWVRACQRM